MSLVLNLPPELEMELTTEAATLGIALSEYALRLIADGRREQSTPRSGADLVAYWQGEGLLGMRPEISDASEHARSLREESQRRRAPD